MEKVCFTEMQVGKLQQPFLYIYRQSVFVCIYISQRFQIVLYSDVFYDAI